MHVTNVRAASCPHGRAFRGACGSRAQLLHSGARQRDQRCSSSNGSTGVATATQLQQQRKELFAQLDKLLQTPEDPGTEAQAMELVRSQLQQQEGGTGAIISAFGSVVQAVPKRIYTIEELRLNGIRAEALLSPQDNSLNFVRNVAQGAAVAGLGALALLTHGDMGQVLSTTVALGFALVLDQVVNQGGGEALLVDSLGRVLLPSYGSRVVLHEAGHLLVAYLVGVLPKTYTVSSLDAFLRFRRLNIQAGAQFCDGDFVKEVASGRLSSASLDRYTCVALAGVVTEYLRFGQAEGGLGDVQQLDAMYRALQFTQLKADGEVRWAVLNVAAILKRHAALQDKLAAAMQQGRPVGQLLEMIEVEVAAAEAAA